MSAFFKTLIRRTLEIVSKAKARQRRSELRGSLEGLETRSMLSAVGYDSPPVAQEIRVITAESSGPLNGVDAVPRSRPVITLSGTTSIETAIGQIDLTAKQRGNRISGTADLSDVDLSGLDLSGINLPNGAFSGIPLPFILNSVTLPEVKFKGTYRNYQLNAEFSGETEVAIIGDVKFVGHVTGSVDPVTRRLTGVLSISINGAELQDQPFSAVLPVAPANLKGRATPRIDGVAGTHDFFSNDLGEGTLTITQTGQDISGTVAAPNLTSGTFNAHFKSFRSRQAKGTAQFQYKGETTTENFNFRISFFRDTSLNRFRYS